MPVAPLGSAGYPSDWREPEDRWSWAKLATVSALLRTPRWVLAVTVAVRLPSVFASRHLTFDDGVYGASAMAMRHGALPFRDVFSSQGPLFLPLVGLADLIGLRTLDGPRLLGVVSALVLVFATYRIALRWTDRWGAGLGALLVGVSGSVLIVSGPLASGGPALALSVAAVAVAVGLTDSPTVRRAIAVGILLGAALSVKNLLVAPTAVPVAMLLLSTRRPRLVVVAAISAVAVGLATALPWGLARVWDQSVTYHLEVHTQQTPLANVGKVLATLADRDPSVLVLSVLAGVTLVGLSQPRITRPWSPGPDALLAAWLVATGVVLLASAPLWRPHMAHLIVPLALFAVRRRPGRTVVLVALAVTLPLQAIHLRPYLFPSDRQGDDARVHAALSALPTDALAISDDPGIVWRAGLRTPDDLVDTSQLRVDTGRITTASLVEAAAAPDVCAVVVWSDRFGELPGLAAGLAEVGFVRDASFDDDRALYLNPQCEPLAR